MFKNKHTTLKKSENRHNNVHISLSGMKNYRGSHAFEQHNFEDLVFTIIFKGFRLDPAIEPLLDLNYPILSSIAIDLTQMM